LQFFFIERTIQFGDAWIHMTCQWYIPD
jgi:hypothetical protein